MWGGPPTSNILLDSTQRPDAPAQGDDVSPSRLACPNGVLSLRPIKALRQLVQRHRFRFQTSVRAHQHSAKTAAESSSALQAMIISRYRRLSFASPIAARRIWMIVSNSHSKWTSTSRERSCQRLFFGEACVKRGCFPPLPIVMGRVHTSLLSQVE